MKSGKLSDERKKKLDEIGFVWTVRESRTRIGSNPMPSEMYEVSVGPGPLGITLTEREVSKVKPCSQLFGKVKVGDFLKTLECPSFQFDCFCLSHEQIVAGIPRTAKEEKRILTFCRP